ncbi:hypothetical protein P2318_03095 [Myxococcaceae bacterium GXIMD 01537]
MTSPRRMSRRAFTTLLGAAAVGAGCGLAGTAGRSVTFRMGLRTALAPGETLPGHFTTDTGWRVELTLARLLLGPIYLFENPSPVAGGQARRWPRVLGELLLPSAHAHETFFSGGRVLGEWDREVVFDALAGARVLGRVPGIAGSARSFSLLLQPASAGVEARELDGHTVLLEGVASREGRAVAFRAGLDFPPPVETQRVDFVPIDAPLEDEGLFMVEVRPHEWFSGASFERVEAPPEGARVTLAPESQAHRALRVNLRRYTAFSGAWEGAAEF